jgi:signal transduction histidine kinase
LFHRNDSVVYETTAPAIDEGRVIGLVVRSRQVRLPRASAQAFGDLLGSGAALLLGNRDGSVWTDLQNLIAGPRPPETSRYRRSDTVRLVETVPIADTPFLIAVEMPEPRVLAPIHSLARNFTLIGLLIVTLGVVLSWRVNSRITRPLTELTTAANAVASGADLPPRPMPTRRDEIGQLERSFLEMAERVRLARDHLEQQVAERTQQLQDAERALARKERLELLGQLAASVSHELRNPLGVMSNVVYYLEATRDTLPSKAAAQVKLLGRQLVAAEKIIGDTLAFSRLRPPEKAAVDLRGLIPEVVAALEVPTGIRIQVEIPDAMPTVLVDPGQIGQILTNLIVNAVQAMQGIGGVVTIRARSQGRRSRIEVEDQGPGIPAEHLSRIFEPLFTTKPRGFGLGLFVSHSLAQSNGGSLSVERAPGRGARFVLELESEPVSV